jgi:hypothetical protein
MNSTSLPSQTHPNTPSYEPFSVCSFRASAAGKCCTTTIKPYQCWNYCAVEQSNFPTWLGCVQQTLNSTWGAACQSADRSPVLTETRPYPASYTNPPPPSDYQYLNARENAAKNSSSTTSASLPAGGKNATTGTYVALPSQTDVKKSGSIRVLELSISGMMCAFLVLSTLAL